MRWAGQVARREKLLKVFFVCGNRPLGRPRREWENDFKIDVKEI